MVSSVSFYNQNNSFYNGVKGMVATHSNDVNNLVKFVNGQPLTSQQETSLGQTLVWTVPALAVFGGIQGVPWLLKNRKNLSGVASTLKAEALAANGRSISKNFVKGLTEEKNRIFKSLSAAEKAAINAKPRNWFGKLLDVIPGYKKLRATGFGQAMGKSGAGWMIAMEGIMNIFTDIIPAFQMGGAKSGIKQIGQSAVKVTGNTVGWIAGQSIGSAAGMAIGTAICPGIGTAIGKFVGGFLGGAITSYYAGKATTSLVGKSEAQVLKDKQLEETSTQIENDANSKIELAKQSIKYANAILAQDPNNKDAQAAIESASKILADAQIAELNPQQTVTTQPATTPAQPAEIPAQPAFNPQTFSFVPQVPGFNGASYDMNIYNQMRTNNMFMPQAFPTTQPQTTQVQQQYPLPQTQQPVLN